MLSLPSTFKSYNTTFQLIKRQPYVYSYRLKLFMLKYGFVQNLLKTCLYHSIKRTQNEVCKVKNLTIDAINENDILSKDYFTYLYALCRSLKPYVVVETGVGLGASSTFILQALQDNGFGQLYSIDLPQATYPSDAGININESAYTSQTDLPGCLIPDHLRKDWVLLLGKSRDKLLPLCRRLGEIDLFFHDSEHTHQNMIDEYDTVWPYLREHGILASHDIDWNGAFTEFTEKHKGRVIISRKGFGFLIHQ